MGASLESGNLISFSIGESTYQAGPGMTFSQWVSSAYNTDGFSLGTNSVIQGETYVVLQDEEFARPSDAIENGYTYKIRTSYIDWYWANSLSVDITFNGLWEGTLYCSTDLQTWHTIITNETVISLPIMGHLYFRGINNTKITGQNAGFTIFNGKVAYLNNQNYIKGNFETMLDYTSVLNGTHPTLGAEAFETICYSRPVGDASDSVLPFNTSEKCFRYMFQSSDLYNLPHIPATILSSECYSGTFSNCNKLTSINDDALPATTMAYRCYYYMFGDDVNLTKSPQLLATALAPQCYLYMFYQCVKLNTLALLGSTSLSQYCYYGMYYGCTLIKLSTTQSGIYQTAYRIPTIGTGTDDGNALSEMFTNTGGTFTGTPSINATYYTSNSIL